MVSAHYSKVLPKSPPFSREDLGGFFHIILKYYLKVLPFKLVQLAEMEPVQLVAMEI
mgnify:CR=1 FL=1|jgi:hypothetical protein